MNRAYVTLNWAAKETLRQLVNRRGDEFRSVKLMASSANWACATWRGSPGTVDVIMKVPDWPMEDTPAGELFTLDEARGIIERLVAETLGIWPRILLEAGAGL